MTLDPMSEVDWSRVDAAYGPATEVPALLQAARGVGEAGEIAVAQLADLLDHQGHPTPAAWPAAPFLVDLLSGECGQRAAVAALLGDLAAGGAHAEGLARDFPLDPLGRELAALLAPAGPALEGMLRSADPDERGAAGLALAMFGDPPPARLAQVGEWLARERTGAPRASAALCLGLLGGGDRDGFVAETHHRAPTVRAAAWIVIARRWPDSLDRDSVEELVAVLPKLRRDRRLWWADGDLSGPLIHAAVRAALSREDLDLAWRLLDRAPRESTSAIAESLAERLFPPHAGPRLRRPAELTDRQRAALESLVERRLASAGVSFHLWRAGLFEMGWWLDPLLGRSPPGPLDGEVGGEPWWRILNDAVGGRLSHADLVERAAACGWGGFLDVAKSAFVDDPVQRAWPPRAAPGGAHRMLPDALSSALGAVFAALPTVDELLSAVRGQAGLRWPGEWCAAALATAAERGADWTADESILSVTAWLLRQDDVIAPMRSVLRRLPPPTRATLLGELEFEQGTRSGRGQVWSRGAWNFIELGPPDPGVPRSIAAIAACPPEAVPVEDVERIFRSFGAAAVPALEEALASPQTPNPEALRRALAAATA